MKEKKILEQDRNCWRIVQAQRAAFLIDGAAYFAAFRAAAEQAQQSILIVGWDIDSNVSLVRDNSVHSELPTQLGPFLNAVLSRRRGLEVHILI
jgi:phospholipase D1/2